MGGLRSYARAVSEWVWFVIAGLAAAGGGALLAVDGGRHSAHQRERRRWAALRGWRFVLSDPVVADRWRHGVMARGGAGLAKDLVIGSLFTPLGRRAVQIFDHEQGGQVSSVVVAVQRRIPTAGLVAELWMPDQPLPQDPGLRILGPVGDRVALVNEPDRVGPLTSAEFVVAINALGGDISVAWIEQDWVLAAAPCDATPSRFERLLRVLDEIADLLDAAHLDNATEPAEFADFFHPGQ
jgi:hypothetical protein